MDHPHLQLAKEHEAFGPCCKAVKMVKVDPDFGQMYGSGSFVGIALPTLNTRKRFETKYALQSIRLERASRSTWFA